MAVGGRSVEPLTDWLIDGRWTRVWASDLSVAATDGAIVEAIDIVLVLSAPFEEAILVVLVWEPGAEVKPFGNDWCG